MRLKKHVPLFESTLRPAIPRRVAPPVCNRCRRYATSGASPENIAVLGGGISGLSSAYFISKEFPTSKITIFESGKATGGWIRSRRVDVPGGDILFEYGPRTLRPGLKAAPTAQLIQDLGLEQSIVCAKPSSAGARNRFLYYPDGLVCMPSPESPPDLSILFWLWRSGLLAGAFNAILEPSKPGRPPNVADESLGSFLSRRFDKRITDNIVSALIHGIYAGDVWQLSARTLLPLQWELEGTYGSLFKGFWRVNSDNELGEQVTLVHPWEYDMLLKLKEIRLENSLKQQLSSSTMFSFKNGLEELVKALQQNLEANPQVEIQLNSPVSSFKMAPGGGQRVQVVAGPSPSETRQEFDLVISTLRTKSLTDFVTVMTVNLFFSKPNLLPVKGFGYLIPQSVPFWQNPERALGVIFDSDAVTGQDTATGTKITVMLGGHWWNGWEHYPDTSEGLDLARSVVQRHLGINDEPAESHVNLSQDCIPQYTVGYNDRLKLYAEKIRDDYRGRVRVVGNQYQGVGVNDCIAAAWVVARDLRGGGWKERVTGLEKVLDTRKWLVAPASIWKW